jgi:hypothetical protein
MLFHHFRKFASVSLGSIVCWHIVFLVRKHCFYMKWYISKEIYVLNNVCLVIYLNRLYLCVSQVTPQAPEFVPATGGGGAGGSAGARSGSPNVLNSFTSLGGSGGPQVTYGGRRSSVASPRPVSPQRTPPPSPPLSNSSPTPTLDKTPVTPVSTYQV